MTQSFAAKWASAISWRNIQTAKLRWLIIALLLVWCIYTLVQLLLAWGSQVSPASEDAFAVTTKPRISSTSLSRAELTELKGFELFGALKVAASKPEVKAKPQLSEAELQAKKSRLDLKLLGLVYTADQSQTLAIIAYKNRQDQYQVGAELPISGRVELSRVLPDRVIISNNGRYESLWLYDENESGTGFVAVTETELLEPKLLKQMSPEQVVSETSVEKQQETQSEAVPETKPASEIAQNYHQQLYRNPAALAQAIQVSPVEQNGEMIGYRVAPGRNPSEFAQLGLKPNDIVTSINNIQLNGPGKALLLYQLMRNASAANLMVKRGDQSVELSLALDGDNS